MWLWMREKEVWLVGSPKAALEGCSLCLDPRRGFRFPMSMSESYSAGSPQVGDQTDTSWRELGLWEKTFDLQSDETKLGL